MYKYRILHTKSFPRCFYVVIPLFFWKMFPEKLSDAVWNTHCYADRANPESEKSQPYFFIPGQICRDDRATCPTGFVFFNSPDIHAFFHCGTFYLAEEVINTNCGQYNWNQAKDQFFSFCHCLNVLPAFIPEKLNYHPVGKTIFYFLSWSVQCIYIFD